MELRKFIERTAATGILGVKITQNGEDMGKHLWDEECRRNIYSASKSFTSSAGYGKGFAYHVLGTAKCGAYGRSASVLSTKRLGKDVFGISVYRMSRKKIFI